MKIVGEILIVEIVGEIVFDIFSEKDPHVNAVEASDSWFSLFFAVNVDSFLATDLSS